MVLAANFVSSGSKIGIGGSLSAPPLPHHRRTGPYTAVREVALTRFDQGWETERFEVGVGKPNRKGLAPGDVPGAAAAAGRIPQFPRHLQCDQCCTTATWCFPLTPRSGPQSQPDPASESDQHLGRFAKAEIAAPAPHIRDEFFHCRLDADALGPSRDLPDLPLEPLQRFRRTLSANARSLSGTGKPSALAVFMLITSSKVVGCSIGSRRHQLGMSCLFTVVHELDGHAGGSAMQVGQILRISASGSSTDLTARNPTSLFPNADLSRTSGHVRFVPRSGHDQASASSRALASLRSGVSKPSVNAS